MLYFPLRIELYFAVNIIKFNPQIISFPHQDILSLKCPKHTRFNLQLDNQRKELEKRDLNDDRWFKIVNALCFVGGN